MKLLKAHGRIAVLLLAASTTIAGCTETPEVTVDYDRDVDFSAYSSFAWAGDEASEVIGDLPVSNEVLEEIKSAINSELIAKGYSQSLSLSDSDFAVSFTVGATTAIEPHIVSGFFADSESSWQWGREYFEHGEIGQTGTRVQYKAETTGELAVIVFDVKERRPVWRSMGAKVLSNRELTGEATTIAVDVERLIQNFAPEKN